MAQRLRDAAASLHAERIPLNDLAAAHGNAALGTVLVLLAAPCLLPVAGVGTALGLGLLAVAMTLWRGDAQVALPARVAALELPLHWARRVLQLLARFYNHAGRHARQRMTAVADRAQRSPWLAAKIAMMAALIILPIPFGNVLPALALMLLGLGLAFRDGVLVLVGAATGGLALLSTSALAFAAWHWGSSVW